MAKSISTNLPAISNSATLKTFSSAAGELCSVEPGNGRALSAIGEIAMGAVLRLFCKQSAGFNKSAGLLMKELSVEEDDMQCGVCIVRD